MRWGFTTMTSEIMAPLMFVGMFVFLLVGFPVAFSLAALGLFFGIIGVHLGFFVPDFLASLPLRVFGSASVNLPQ